MWSQLNTYCSAALVTRTETTTGKQLGEMTPTAFDATNQVMHSLLYTTVRSIQFCGHA